MALIYLDNNATTRPAEEVVAAMREVHESLWANPSSVHRFGQGVRQRLELARAAVARLINCRERELIFTSGGTESNNLALRGVLEADDGRPLLITTPIEHSAIRQPASMLAQRGIEVVYLPADRQGRVSPTALEEALNRHAAGRLTLVSVQWANNETGVIQPVAELAGAARNYESGSAAAGARARVIFHVDATQAVGKLPVDVRAMGIDLMSFSAHKFHGPKGVGGLFARLGVRLRPQNIGGPQERDRRGGTENTAGIVGMGVAADLAREFLADEKKIAALTALRDRFEAGILAALPGTVINSQEAPRLWNTSNLAFPRLEAEAILLGLSEKGLCASAGAACSSGSLEPSPVLLAMGVPAEVAHGSVRFSLSRLTTAAEIEQAIELVPAVVRQLARTLPMGV